MKKNLITVVYWDNRLLKPGLIKKELDKRIKWVRRSQLRDNTDFLKNIKWDIIYTSGWVDKEYLQLLLKLKFSASIIGIDDMYNGTLKQKLLPYFGLFIKKFFTHAWVAGIRQYEYARRLGFNHNDIVQELLVAQSQFKEIKYLSDRKCFLYIGAMRKIKGVSVLVKAFENYRKSGGNWNLRLVGNNLDYDSNFFIQDGVIFRDLIPNDKLQAEFEASSAFIMPGIHEQWGVSLHEATLAGQPVICSSMVGSSSHLLINNYNGFAYNKSVHQLFEAMLKVSKLSNQELESMSLRSRKLASRITAETSIANLLSIV